MLLVQYKSKESDRAIIDDITAKINQNLGEWYGFHSKLAVEFPTIRSHKNSFILRYPITTSSGEKKNVLVKIRRYPRMNSLSQAIRADIHGKVPMEYQSLKYVFDRLVKKDENFGVVRPLAYFDAYFAIVMEEFPSRTLRQILAAHRHSSSTGKGLNELKDAAKKTGQWLHYFHQHVHSPSEREYTREQILDEIRSYAIPLEDCSHGRVHAQSILDAFSQKLENVQIDSIVFSQSHADMICDNVLYSNDKKVCVIDFKTRHAPIYSDLGLILIHPETFKLQIFSGGVYLPESLLREYRTAILEGYFGDKPVDQFFIKLYSAIKVLDRWRKYEEQMRKYKGVRYLILLPIAPMVTAYFKNVLMKHLDSIEVVESSQAIKVAKSVDHSA